MPQPNKAMLRILVTSVALSVPMASLTGCMEGSFPSTGTPSVETGAVVSPPLQGNVYGGHAPLIGAKVYVLTPNQSALYGQAVSLMDGDSYNPGLSPSGTGNGTVSSNGTNGYHYVTTDATGAYNLGGDYACTVDQAVYLVAVGGSPTFPSGTNTFNIAGASGANGTATETYISGGTITGITVTGAGGNLTGGTYNVNATGGGGTGAVAHIVVNNGNLGVGTVTSATITTAGSGYTSSPTFSTTAWNVIIGTSTQPTFTTPLPATIEDDVQFTVSTSGTAGTAGPPENFYIGEGLTFTGLPTALSTLVGSTGTVIATGLTTTTFDVQVPGSLGTGTASFTITAPATVVGAPTGNPAAINMTALGLCPASGSFAGTLSYIYTNEVSTSAMAIAMAAFGSGPFNVGLATGGTVDAHYASYDKNGMKQALNNAGLLYDITGGNLTTSYAGEGHIARTVTPAGNGIIPQALVDTWGNVLAACVDSNNTGTGSLASPQCATLFSTATSTGIACTVSSGTITCPSGTTAPTDIATAAFNIAHFPAGTATTVGTNPAFVNALYTLPTGNLPFTPNLVSTGAGQPNDFSVAIGFFAPTSAGSTTTNSIQGPQAIAINGGNFVGNEAAYTSDAAGELQESVWIANFNGPVVKLNANGGAPDYATNTALKNNAFSGGGIDSRSVVIDGSQNVWVAVQFGQGAQEFSVMGASVQTFVTASGNGNYIGGNDTGTLLDGAVDGAGTSYNLYLAGYTSGIVDKVAVVNGTTSTATNVQGAGGTGTAAFSTATAKTNSGTAACVTNVVTFAFAPSGTMFLNADSNTATPYEYNANGFVCTLNTATGAQGNSAGTGSGFEFQNYGQGPATIAVDANGAAWIGGGQPAAGTPSAGSSNGVYKIVSSGATATKTAYTGGGMSAPCGVAVDGADNIWIGNAGTYGVAEVSNAGVALSPVANIGAYANAYGGFNPQVNTTWALNGNTYMTPQTTDSNCASPAIDRAGDIWMAYQGNSYYPGLVFEILGIAAPVVSPRAYATFGNGTTGFLGQRPN